MPHENVCVSLFSIQITHEDIKKTYGGTSGSRGYYSSAFARQGNILKLVQSRQFSELNQCNFYSCLKGFSVYSDNKHLCVRYRFCYKLCLQIICLVLWLLCNIKNFNIFIFFKILENSGISANLLQGGFNVLNNILMAQNELLAA